MALFKRFIFDGIDSLEYGIYITGEAVYNAPRRAMSLLQVPGKNGSLAIDQGYFENIEVSYPAGCFAKSQEDFAKKIQAFRNAIAARYSYKKLVDEYNADEYRMALYKSGLEVNVVSYHRAGEFKITFECKPQRFLIDGDAALPWISNYQALLDENSINLQDENGNDIEGGVTEVTTIANTQQFASKPLIIATGSGVINIGAQKIEISGIKEGQNIYIDCESMEVYTLSGSIPVSVSSSVSFNTADFPEIPPGVSGFSSTMPVQVIPRWWRL